MKSTYLKDLLISEYQETIAFNDRTEMNKGGFMMLTEGVTALKLLLRNLASRLSEKIKETHAIPSPPRVDYLEEAEEICGLLLQLLSWLK